jgi:PhoPQ-activated pathogenicity-related protein
MISGEWLDSKKVDQVEWWHYVDIIIPKQTTSSTGIMFIDGGEKSEDYFRLDAQSIQNAIKTEAVIVNVSNIPFQPLNFLSSEQDSFEEDDLIAFAWNKFLKQGAKQKDVEWLPRFPMTRAIVRAMDLAQEIILQNDIVVKDFVVSGASKRGWTAWTTAAVDSRVKAVVPMVIDMLNLVPSFENHYRSYGEFSPAVQEYVNYNIQDWLGTEEFKVLMSYIEPFSFVDKFTMPKYIINAGSDEFFSTDSWRFYYDKLPGEKIIRYVPNKNHSLDGRYLTEDLVSYFYRVINDIEIPSLSWNLSDNKLIAELDYDGEYDVSVWTAKNDNGRDFRLWEEGELWEETSIGKLANNKYELNVNSNFKGYKATMIEFTIDPESEFPLIISTGPFVFPEKYPFDKYESK